MQEKVAQAKLEGKEKDCQPCDMQLSESSFLRRCGREWKRSCYAIQGNRILKLKYLSSQSREDQNNNLDEDEIEVEQYMDIGLCQFQSIRIEVPNTGGLTNT